MEKLAINNFVDRKNQTIYTDLNEFIEEINIGDGVCLFLVSDFDLNIPDLNKLKNKLKKLNTLTYVYEVDFYSPEISNILKIVDFMNEKRVTSIIAIGEDFLVEICKSINLFYNNQNIKSLEDIKEYEGNFRYENIRDFIFIPTTGGGSETHRYFKVIDDIEFSILLIDDYRCAPDKILIDDVFLSKGSNIMRMYYAFSIIGNCVDLIMLDNVEDSIKNISKNILIEMTELFKSGNKFGDSSLFRQKIIECSLKSSDLIDKEGYGIIFLYGNLLEILFKIPRHTLNALSMEFFLNFIRKDSRFYLLQEYFYNIEISTKINTIFTYESFISAIKKKYGAKDNISIYNLDEDIINGVKKICYESFKNYGMSKKYKLFKFDEEINDRLFRYYIDGVKVMI